MEQKPNTYPNGRRKNKIRNFDTTVDLLFSEIKALKRRQDQLEQFIKLVADAQSQKS